MGYIVILLLIHILLVGVPVWMANGLNADEIRDKVVTYCIEKPQLCKEEYQNIKTQNNWTIIKDLKLND